MTFSFLTKIEECQRQANLSEEELLATLSVLFTGKVEVWYRNRRNEWNSWHDFCQIARLWYGMGKRYQKRLKAEAIARTQGQDEPVRDYITSIEALMRK